MTCPDPVTAAHLSGHPELCPAGTSLWGSSPTCSRCATSLSSAAGIPGISWLLCNVASRNTPSAAGLYCGSMMPGVQWLPLASVAFGGRGRASPAPEAALCQLAHACFGLCLAASLLAGGLTSRQLSSKAGAVDCLCAAQKPRWRHGKVTGRWQASRPVCCLPDAAQISCGRRPQNAGQWITCSRVTAQDLLQGCEVGLQQLKHACDTTLFTTSIETDRSTLQLGLEAWLQVSMPYNVKASSLAARHVANVLWASTVSVCSSSFTAQQLLDVQQVGVCEQLLRQGLQLILHLL